MLKIFNVKKKKNSGRGGVKKMKASFEIFKYIPFVEIEFSNF
jgi:hypothetical protein